MEKKKGKIVFSIVLMLIILISLYFLFSEKGQNGITEKSYCSISQRNADFCTEVYMPVCGFVRVECITTPCNLQPQTFSNECFACQNERVEYYTDGECK
jgi:hypothetical protein